MAVAVAKRRRGSIVHDGNSGIIPFSSVLTNQKEDKPEPKDLVGPVNEYPPSEVSTSELATS